MTPLKKESAVFAEAWAVPVYTAEVCAPSAKRYFT
jgi:hypothetical protein